MNFLIFNFKKKKEPTKEEQDKIRKLDYLFQTRFKVNVPPKVKVCFC